MTPLQLDIKDFPIEFNYDNGQFPPLDALTYWHFLKNAKKVIEIGCGFSTYLAFKSGKDLTAIDPEPRIIYNNINYIRKYVQDVSLDYFLKLENNDILFIDSSHIYSKGSDVEYLVMNILPYLNKGVIIHFHDYFDKDGYPSEWKNYPNMRDWNESEYLLNLKEKYKVLVVNHLVCKYHNDELKIKYPFVPNDIKTNFGAVRGSSLWLKNI
jgi:hypothetical protein